MKLWIRLALGLGVAVLAAPAALLVTVMLSPFWNWFESVSGIESMGHSGPANWCFVAVYGLLLVVAATAWWRRRASPPKA
jgi:H+/Cl- antiporter ClcA